MPNTKEKHPRSQRKKAALKRFKFTVSLPGEVEQTFNERLRQLSKHYGSRQAYIESLIAYDMWAQKDHLLTGPCFNPERPDELPRMWAEILRDFNKPNKTGSWFEHRVSEITQSKRQQSGD